MTKNKSNITIDIIEVKKLFGMYNYKISCRNKDPLMILYGDNGCGKTTILNCLIHLLSPEPKGGHRTYLGKVIFKEFKVVLSNNITIQVIRKEAIDGSYKICCIENSKNTIDWEWIPHEGSNNIENEEIYNNYCRLMDNIALNIHYLPANRKTDINEKDNDNELILQYINDNNIVNKGRRQNRNNDDDVSLETINEKFMQWLRRQTIILTNNGYRSINDFYYDVIKALVSPRRKIENAISKEEIVNKIELLENKNKEYIKYGLSGEMLNKDILKTIGATSDIKFKSIYSILNPYIESMELRLKSLEVLQTLLGKLENYLNQFLTDKYAVIDIENGVRIFTKQKNYLEFKKLSSGERQIILLLCSVIISERESNIVIIDEPEISLNIKWQRIFIKSLQDLVINENCQLIIATHSIEMITRYKESVSILRSENEN